MKPRITPERFTEKLNTIRQIIDQNPLLRTKKFTRTEFLIFLKNNGLTVNLTMWSYLKDLFRCERIQGVDKYSFHKDDKGTLPIYKGNVERVVSEYHKKMMEYKSQDLSVASAINLLKSHGYKIQKPVVSYKEI